MAHLHDDAARAAPAAWHLHALDGLGLEPAPDAAGPAARRRACRRPTASSCSRRPEGSRLAALQPEDQRRGADPAWSPRACARRSASRPLRQPLDRRGAAALGRRRVEAGDRAVGRVRRRRRGRRPPTRRTACAATSTSSRLRRGSDGSITATWLAAGSGAKTLPVGPTSMRPGVVGSGDRADTAPFSGRPSPGRARRPRRDAFRPARGCALAPSPAWIGFERDELAAAAGRTG